MNPFVPSQADRLMWAGIDDVAPTYCLIGGPEEAPDVIPCPALVGVQGGVPVVHVGYELDEIEVAALAQGGRLWFTTWGGLPVHHVMVVPRQ